MLFSFLIALYYTVTRDKKESIPYDVDLGDYEDWNEKAEFFLNLHARQQRTSPDSGDRP